MKTYFRIALALSVLTFFAFTTPLEKKKNIITVVIDVSHGGSDAGMQHDHLAEKDLVRQIAAKMEALNSDANIQLHFTRRSDENIPLHHRVGYINSLEPDMVLSLHINANEKSEASGVSVFYSDNSSHKTQSKSFADTISSLFEAEGLFSAATAKTAPFYILKNSQAPAVLVELGYLTNADDREKLINSEIQEAIAKTLLLAIDQN
ncbi:MAG: N-acetylmuramoyl-L-alanine amidase [Marinirhabdus sp.]|nr:N-acetylmuramoyl-L-alanine amidase [Marinirhabdus sp.]